MNKSVPFSRNSAVQFREVSLTGILDNDHCWQGVEVRGPHTGHEGWATVYTPVGYTLRADNILATIRSRVADTAASCTNVRLYESHAVTSIDRSHTLAKHILSEIHHKVCFIALYLLRESPNYTKVIIT